MTPRTLRDEGIVITGRLTGAHENQLCFADDLRATPSTGDAFVALIKARIDAYIEANALDLPVECNESPIADTFEPLRELDLDAAGVTAIVWATGYRMDFGWIFDAEFDGQGFPMHKDGISPESVLYFVGLPWLTSRGSSFIPGARPDAGRVVAHIAARPDSPHPIQTPANALTSQH